MLSIEKDHLEILRCHFVKRQERNSRYSLRAFSNFLEIDPSSLSKIFSGKRSFPKNMAADTAEKLKLNDEDTQKFLKSVLRNTKKEVSENKEKREFWEVIDTDYYEEVIRDWEYFAILNLVELDDFKPSISHISSRLGIDVLRTEEVISKLLEIKLLKEDVEGGFSRTKSNIQSTNEIPSESIVEAHRQELVLTMNSLINEKVDRRGAYSIYVKTNPEAVAKVKALCMDYLERITKLLEKGPKTEVYQVGLQLTPLTRKTNEFIN